MGIDFRSLSPAAQKQVLAKMAKQSKSSRTIIRNLTGQDFPDAAEKPVPTGEVLFQAVVRGTPITKKNSMEIRKRKDGTPYISQSGQHHRYADDFKSQLLYAGPPISVLCNVREIYYMPDRRKVDQLNLQAATDDLLVECGVLEDDNSRIVGGHDGSRVRIDRKDPRVEITITKMEEENDAT